MGSSPLYTIELTHRYVNCTNYWHSSFVHMFYMNWLNKSSDDVNCLEY